MEVRPCIGERTSDTALVGERVRLALFDIDQPESWSSWMPDVTRKTRVLVVDDYRPMRDALIELIQACDGMEPAGQPVDGLEGIELARSLAPDIVLMDVNMPRMDGIEATSVIPGNCRPHG